MSKATKSACVMFIALCVQFPSLAYRSDHVDEGSSCPASPGWFPKTPSPANARPKPDSDCDFYKWAWQTFLFVTQSDFRQDGEPRFLEFQTPSELFVMNGNHLLRTIGKAHIPSNLSAVVQPGSRGVLVDQSGRAIYYATHLNSVLVKFIRDAGYSDFAKLKNAPATQQFPKGSLELKSSWRIVAPGEDARKFFTIRTAVPLLTLKHGQVLLEPAKTREETIALLGLHVVGVVEGHPEFIWATFEHNDNAPDLPTDLGPERLEPIDSRRNWTLYPKGTRAAHCNKKPGQSPIPPLIFADEDQQILQPRVPVFRQFPFGGDDDPDQIRRLNSSVHRQIPRDLAVWKNYSLMGALWLNCPDRDYKENSDFNQADALDPAKKILGGDKKLSNTTMETFTQSTQNCFSCHNTMAQAISPETSLPPKKLNVSHSLTTVYMHLTQCGEQTTAPCSVNALTTSAAAVASGKTRERAH